MPASGARRATPCCEKYQAHMLLEVVLRNPAKKRRDAHLVVHVDSGRAAADGVHPRQMLRRAAQGFPDSVAMILWIALEIRIPPDLLREDDFAIHQRRAFPVASPEIKPDPAAVEIAPERDRRLPWFWHLVAGFHLHRTRIGFAPHEIVVKCPCAARRVNGPDLFRNLRLSGNQHFVSAALPEKEFQ